MIEVKPGDWVLIDSAYMEHQLAVGRITAVTAKAVLVNPGIREDDEDSRRLRKFIRGVFKSQAQAEQARVVLRGLAERLRDDLKSAVKRYHTAALGTLLAEVPE